MGSPVCARQSATFSKIASKICAVFAGRGSSASAKWRAIHAFLDQWTRQGLLVGKCLHQWSWNPSKAGGATLATLKGATSSSPQFLWTTVHLSSECEESVALPSWWHEVRRRSTRWIKKALTLAPVAIVLLGLRKHWAQFSDQELPLACNRSGISVCIGQ